MTARSQAIVVVGASLAGVRAAEELRCEGFDGSITVVGDEVHAPYDRPPLSKQVLAGHWDIDRLPLTAGVDGGIDQRRELTPAAERRARAGSRSRIRSRPPR